MTQKPAMAFYDAFIKVEQLAHDIFREADNRRMSTGLHPTDTQIAAMVGLEGHLSAALSAFRAEIEGAKQ